MKDGTTNRPAPLSIRLPDNVRREVEERAKERGRSVSSVIIGALRKGLGDPDRDADR